MMRIKSWGAEGLLVLVASAAFLGFLGSTELWGKREQRASAEALDTVEHGRWLVAEIQGRPRLEKPPLPRWITASLMIVTGRRDEAIVRLPNALAGLATVLLVYWLGRGLGGREVGLASGFALASSWSFLIEMRQAGNDGFLAFFTTLALLAAWKRLNGSRSSSNPREAASSPPTPTLPHKGGGSQTQADSVPFCSPPPLWGRVGVGGHAAPPENSVKAQAANKLDPPGGRGWSLLLYSALGLGFLTKGPIILLMVGMSVVGYLAMGRRFRSGLRILLDGWGLVLFLSLALAWPVPVLIENPAAARVWWLEIAQKTGTLDMPHDKVRESVALDWFGMTMPWTPFAVVAALWPLRKSSRSERPELALAWWWAIGNLGVLALWKVAKPSYYLPCLPGVALLIGSEWVRLTRLARLPLRGSVAARGLLQAYWVALFVAAALATVVVGELAPKDLGWGSLGALELAVAVLVGAWAWRRGRDVGALIPLSMAFVGLALMGYGAIAPIENPSRGHRELARRLEAMVPPEATTVWFFNDVDEGLWFYLKGHNLAPVAASRFNRGFDLRVDAAERQIDTPARRVEQARDQLADWAKQADPGSSFVLIRAKIYDRFADDLAELVEPVYREEGLKRNELVLLRVRPETLASRSAAAARR